MKSIIGYIDVLVPPDFDDDTIKSDVVAKEGKTARLIVSFHSLFRYNKNVILPAVHSDSESLSESRNTKKDVASATFCN